ncbi:hypothetical protein GCM10009560_13830 [Nonomuraea longicatena]|uniref:Uncharacterized protein n=1 Tax=Nonomuraea longicatena TaxID=83682 RepID=A0ABP3Z969_9ACTN
MAEEPADLVRALLQGGPDSLSRADRQRRVAADEPEVKIPRGHCTEHFRRTVEIARIGEREYRIYRWSYRTYVAE